MSVSEAQYQRDSFSSGIPKDSGRAVQMFYNRYRIDLPFFFSKKWYIRVLNMMLPCRLTCILASSKGCAPVGIPLVPEGGLEA